MKKLATIIAAASLSLAAPAFACPHEDAEAPKTAENDKAKEQPKQQAPKKEAPKQEAPKQETPKTAKETPKKEEPKKPTKVSQK
jgi:translation initiation factor IF-3